MLWAWKETFREVPRHLHQGPQIFQRSPEKFQRLSLSLLLTAAERLMCVRWEPFEGQDQVRDEDAAGR